jgi:hypothetical protein
MRKMIPPRVKGKVFQMKASGFNERVIARDTGLTEKQVNRLCRPPVPKRKPRKDPESAAAWELLLEGYALNTLEKMFDITELERRAMRQHVLATALTNPESPPMVNVDAH